MPLAAKYNPRRLACLGALLLGAAWLFWVSHTWGFKGDGRLRYLGPLRPSYRLTMPAIPLDKLAEYQYRFRGLPSENDMSFLLNIAGKRGRDRQELEILKTRIEASLTDSASHPVCTAFGVPGGAPWAEGQTEKWILETGPGHASFWHKNCVHFGTHHKQSYVLQVRIKDVDQEQFSYQRSREEAANFLDRTWQN